MESILYNSNYGSNSRKIYEKFCETLNWDKSKSYKFGFRRPLFAHNADTERTRDVWFISHSNLNENIALAGNRHINRIQDEFIYEFYIDSEKDKYPLNDRIVFAKNKLGYYIFLGIYRSVNPYSKDPNRTFIRIDKNYLITQEK